MINALFVHTDGVYFDLDGVIPWDIEANALTCTNKLPAICHPPCKRWGRYWSGGSSAKEKKLMGDDNGAFAFSLWYVRTFGGIIEHPEGSHAYRYYGLNCPKQKQGWIKADEYGGLTCSVAQGNYGHRSRKMTWLYINKIKPIELDWSIPKGMMRMDKGRVKVKRGSEGYKPKQRIKPEENFATPTEFRDLLIKMMRDNYEYNN
jgi:hypothetical protein